MVDNTLRDILLIILTIFLPPLAVFIKDGCGVQLLLNILLLFLGYIPGLIHAIYICFVRTPGLSVPQNEV